MSNKTQLQTNNTALDALITRVNAAKDVAASLPEASDGSGSVPIVETCAITFNYSSTSTMILSSICYTKLSDNGPEVVNLIANEFNSASILLENVICNTLILAYMEEGGSITYEMSSNINSINDEYISIYGARIFVATSGDTGTITVYNNFQ